MKIRITMKDPDTLHDAIDAAVRADLAQTTLSPSEQELLRDTRVETVQEIAARWFKYGEYLSVEIDTEMKTCTVQEAR